MRGAARRPTRRDGWFACVGSPAVTARCRFTHVHFSRLPGVLRPADQRARRHHRARRAAVRSDHRRDPDERRERAALLHGRARGNRARGVQVARQRRDRYLQWPAGGLRGAAPCAGDRSGAARGVRFRVRVSDGAHEPAARSEDRNGVHDAGRTIHVHQLTLDQRGLLARRPGARPRARSRGKPAAREGPGEENMTLADRTTRIAGSPTMIVTATVDRLRRSGVEVIDFGAGEPDFPTPDAIKAAAHAALDANFTRYTPAAGIADLKRAICDRYRSDYGVEYTESEVIVTAGGKQALYNTALSLFGPGDEVITHAPYWPTLTEQIKLADATPVLVRTHPEDGFAIRSRAILAAITPRTRGIIINSPCNPTGALISENDLAEIADAAARQGIWILIDLCYEKLIYDAVAHNLPAVLSTRCRDLTVLCGSASKAYAMTGWRCGWALAPAPVIAAAAAIQSHSTSNVSSITQKAALAALTGSQTPVRVMLDEYRTRRDNLYDWLTADHRLRCRKPAGAFYMFIDVGDVLAGLDPPGFRTSTDFAQALLDESRVAVT